MEVLVKGPCQRFPEVRDALSGTPLHRLLLKRCTPHVSKPTQQTTLPTPLTSTPLTLATYASTSHTPMTHTLTPKQDNDSDDSDSTIVYELPQPDMDILNISNKNVTGYGKTDHFVHNFKIELLVFKGSIDLKQ